MNVTSQIPEIGAEMLLSLLYPEIEDKWIVYHDGTFYRNYNRDILALSPDEMRVWLSRDSLLGLLPQGLYSIEDDLRKGDRTEKIKELELQMKILAEAFLPFDTLSFRRLLKAERSVEDLLGDKLAWLIKNFIGFDLSGVQNPYVREFAVLLPGIRQWRGNFELLKSLLASVFHCDVRMQERRWSETDSTLEWLPEIRYELIIPGLSPEKYRTLQADILPLSDFLAEWYMPLEVRLEIAVREPHSDASINSGLILDYNTEL